MNNNKTVNMIKKAFRVPVIFAVIGAYLNSAELLAEFQPDSRAWVAYVAAASVGIGLFLSVEALLHKATPVMIAAVLGYGVAEIIGQVLHAALVRGDVVVMTETMRWVMGYVSPSLVVVAGVGAAFVAHYGLMDYEEENPMQLVVKRLEAIEAAQQPTPATHELVPLSELLEAAQRVQNPNGKVVDLRKRVITSTTPGQEVE